VVSERDRMRRRNAYRNAVLKSAFKFNDESNRSILTAQLRVLVDIHEQLDDLKDEFSKLNRKR
jgi:hypothetical protein